MVSLSRRHSGGPTSFRFNILTNAYVNQRDYLFGFVLVIQLLLLQVFGVTRITRYTGLHEVINLNLACTVGTLLLLVFNLLTYKIFRLPELHVKFPIYRTGDHILRIPWRVIIQYFFLANFGVTSVRIGRRVVGERLLFGRTAKSRRVIIVGAGDAGEQVVRDMRRHESRRYLPVAFVDPDPLVVGRRIHRRAGGGDAGSSLLRILAARKPQMVVVALPRPTPRLLQSRLDQCQQARIEFKIIPT